jgi:hypothetical protein
MGRQFRNRHGNLHSNQRREIKAVDQSQWVVAKHDRAGYIVEVEHRGQVFTCIE